MSSPLSGLSVSSYANAYQPSQFQTPTQQPLPDSSAKNVIQNAVPTLQSTNQTNNSQTNNNQTNNNDRDTDDGGGSSLGNTIDMMA